MTFEGLHNNGSAGPLTSDAIFPEASFIAGSDLRSGRLRAFKGSTKLTNVPPTLVAERGWRLARMALVTLPPPP